ncbi:MAG TPA: chorismate synthase [Bacteroidales bacterium]|nr:chorismate synthase [Bacteroidales bacterium]
MPANTFGEIFRLTTFGESHGAAIGGVIDGCPPGLSIDMDFIQLMMRRRRPGQSHLTTPRQEQDMPEILSGVLDGQTTGTPLAFIIRNSDQRSGDYDHLKDLYRPSHADFTYMAKYGLRDHRGGGRSSARETAARVFAGALAMLFLQQHGISIRAWVSAVGQVEAPDFAETPPMELIESNMLRCPHDASARMMEQHILEAAKNGDTLGGIITGSIMGLPAGLGAPVFDKFHADLGKAILSINAVKGFEYGSGFAGTRLPGSAHNDQFSQQDGKVITLTNHSGGVQGGITNGMEVRFRAAFKPVATLMQSQQTITVQGGSATLNPGGRHDVCVLPRAVVIVEAMAALVCIDHWLRQKMYE